METEFGGVNVQKLFLDTPCMSYLPTLGWFQGSIYAIHGVSGIDKLY